jgi:hypothetical protein
MIENDTSRIIIDDSRVPLQIMASLMEDSRSIIDDRKNFIVEATSWMVVLKILKVGQISLQQ